MSVGAAAAPRRRESRSRCALEQLGELQVLEEHTQTAAFAARSLDGAPTPQEPRAPFPCYSG